MWLRSLALACLVGAALAGPVQRQSDNQCAKQCRPPTNPKFGYQIGNMYKYEYKGENNVSIGGIQKEYASIEADTEFHIISACEVVLKLKNIRIDQKIPQKEKDKLIKELSKPLRFTWIDGKFDHVCPSHEESKQSLNIKKGIISPFVNEMPNLDESQTIKENDSFGTCLTKYTVQNGEEKVITKEKDLRTCSNKHIIKTDLFKTKFPSFLMYKVDRSVCTQLITPDHIYNTVDCLENQVMQNPLKRKEEMKFDGRVTLKHIETKPADKQSWQEPFIREDIAYSIAEPRQGDRNMKEVKRVLKDMCEKTDKVIDISIGSSFFELISYLRSLVYKDLLEIHQYLKDGSVCSSSKVRHMFVDAVAMAATDDCIKMMVKMTVDDEVTLLQRTLWTVAMAFRGKTTPDTIASMIPLMKKNPSTPQLIAIANQVHNLCSSEDCEKIPAVDEIVALLDEKLGPKCSSDDNKQKLKALAAFGNMGYHGKAHDNIVACATDRSLPKKIRLEAVDSFRRMETKRPQEFLQIVDKKDEDPEIKMSAFKSVVRHADREQINNLKGIVKEESNIQVSSYMYTCIQNMKNAKSPNLRKQQKLLQNNEINPRRGDYLTHSKNILHSFFNKEKNIGGSVDSDFIHSSKTKLPTSMGTKVSGYHGDQVVGILETKLRTEGVDRILENIFAMKDKLPKMQQILRKLDQNPSAEEIKEEFKELISHKILGDNDTDLEMIIRFLDMEIMHFSASELISGIFSEREELFKIADLLTKLARGKDADFSHSFVFMNSKIVVPSVTGRSYSIDLAGSSTVGLTAKAKADMLNLPRNADLHFHFQPSVNVEFSTSCGLESDSHRPSLKHVSRVHLESDVEVSAEVRDGHIAVFKLNLPSEDIAKAKMSTDIVEIDPDHNEKSVFESKEKKIDYTFEHLSKPLGVVASAKLELPKPFFIKRFPFIFPFGSGEIGLKRSDVKSYEMRFEIPKQAGPSMKCKASFDTPGSKVNRRFEVVGEVKRQRDQKGLVLELITPFETVGGRGKITYSDKLAGASVELYTSKKPVVSANVSCETISSRSRVNYKLSGAVSFLNQEPARIDGSVAVIKGRKNHVSYDIRTNKPVSKPIVLKGTIMQEGLIGLSPKSEWKLSSDIAVESPFADLKLRKTVERRPKQTQMTSANFGFDYQLSGQEKHSFAISGTSQKSSNKVNTNVKLESTQFPGVNTHLAWDMQREEGWKHDIKLNCKEASSKTCIQVKHKSFFPKNGPGYCRFALEIPRRNIDYKVEITHHIDLQGEEPGLILGFDLCNEKDKHIKAKLDMKRLSKNPLNILARLEGEYEDTRIVLVEKIEETRHNGDNAIVGDVIYTITSGQETKESKLHYVYRKRSDDSKVHHEIESSVKTPLSRSPINSKASIQLSSESLAIAGHIGPEHSIEALLKEDGKGFFSLKLPIIEGTVNYTSKGTEKSIKADLKTRNRRTILEGKAELGARKHFEFSIKPDVYRAPEKEIIASIGGENKAGKILGNSKLQVLDLLDVSLTEEGDESLFGNQEITLKVKTQNKDQLILNCKNTIVDGHAKLAIVVSKNNKNKINIDLDAGMKHSDNKIEILAEISCKSKDLRIKDMRMSLKTEVTRSESSLTMRTDASVKKDDKVYKAELSSDITPNELKVTAEMQTPHVNFEKTTVGVSLQVLDSSVSSSLNIAYSDEKKILIQTKIETTNSGLKLNSKVYSDKEQLAVLHLILDNNRNKKSLKVQVDAKNEKIYEAQGIITLSSDKTLCELSAKSDHPAVKLRELIVNIQRSRNSASASAIAVMDNKDRYTCNSDIKSQEDGLSGNFEFVTPKSNGKAHMSTEKQESKWRVISYLDFKGERKGDVEITFTALSQGIQMKARSKTAHAPEISAHAKWEKSGESILAAANVMKGASPLFSTSFNRLSNRGEEKLLMKTKTLEDTLLDLEISKEVNSYSLKAKGPFPPVHVKISRNSDKKSINTELLMCRHKSCYSLKCHSESLKHRIYLEKSDGQSKPQKVVIVTAEKSKAIVEMNGEKYGIELTLHQRENDDKPCELVGYIYIRKCISSFKASILHSKTVLHLKAEITSNTDKPNDKMGVEIKSQTNPDNDERSGLIRAFHYRNPEEFLITYTSIPVGDRHDPLRLCDFRVVVHSGLVLEKTWTLRGKPNIDQEHNGIRSMEYIVYNGDKSTVLSWLMTIHNSVEEKKLESKWKLVTNKGERKCAMTFTLSDKNDGKIIKVMISIPSADYEVQGSPNDINFSISSSGRKQKEINIKVSERCAVLEYRKSAKSDPEFRSHICMNKPENKGLHLAKVIVEYREKKCYEFRVTVVDKENPENVDVIMRCTDEESCRDLEKKIARAVSEIKQEITQVLKQSKKKISEPLRNIRQYLNDCLYSNLENMRKESIRISKKIKEYILNIYHTRVPAPVKEACHKHYEDIHREANRYIKKAKEVLNQFWPCDIEWYCTDIKLEDIKLAIQKFDSEKAQKAIERKVNEIKESLQLIWPSDILHFIQNCASRLAGFFQSIISNVAGFFQSIISSVTGFFTSIINSVTKYVQGKIIQVFGKVVGKTIIYTMSKMIKKFEKYTEVAEMKMKQKLVDTVDGFIDKMRHIWSQDENVQAAKQAVVDGKNEIIDAWRNRDHIVRSHAERVKSNITENLKKLRDDQIEILRYDPKNGAYSFRLRRLNGYLSYMRGLISRFRF